MRLLLGLMLGLALFAQPGMTAAQENHKPPGQKKHAQNDKQAADVDAGPVRPQPVPQAQPEPASEPEPEPERKPEPKAKEPKRKDATEEPRSQPAPKPAAPAIAAIAAATPVHTAAPVPAPAATAAPLLTAQPQPRPRRRAAPRRRPRTQLNLRRPAAVVTRPAAAVVAATPPPARVLPLLRPHMAAQTARPSSTSPPLAAAVERIIEVVPGPVRLALAILFALAVTFAAGFWLVGRRAHRLARDSATLVQDLGLLQSALLPVLPERIGRAWVSAAYRPAEGLAAGGDFYDAFALPGQRTCLVVGDVTGHGRDAIPLTAAVRYTLRAYIEGGLGPRAALQATATVLAPRLAGRLVTAVAAIYDPRAGRLTFASAGHPPPVFAGEDTPVCVAAASPPLGAGVPTGRRQTTVPLPPGTAACFYTDGLTDVRVGSGRLGPERLAEQVQSLGPRDDAATVLANVVRESDEQPDDMAACLLRPMPTAMRSLTERVEELEVDAADLAAGRVRRFLEACGVPETETDVALDAARELVGSTGAVVVEIQGAVVSVRRPEPAVLPVPLVDAG